MDGVGEKFKASEDMLLRKIAGEYILIPVGPLAIKVHGMITLSESGQFLWEKLQNECDLQELTDVLLGEYEIDRRTAEEDVKEFLDKLDQVGLLVRNGGEQKE